jgi:phage terminase large subunit
MSRAGGMQADLPGSSTNMESVSPYTTRAFHLSLVSTMRMAFSRVSRADCSTVDNTGDGIKDASHTCMYHVFVANTRTVLTARVYRHFTVVDVVSITETEELSNLTTAQYIVYIALNRLLQLCRAGAEK